MKKIKNNNLYCPECGGLRWQTVIKGESYRCRSCNFVGVGVKLEDLPKRVEVKQKRIERLSWWQKIINFFKRLFKI